MKIIFISIAIILFVGGLFVSLSFFQKREAEIQQLNKKEQFEKKLVKYNEYLEDFDEKIIEIEKSSYATEAKDSEIDAYIEQLEIRISNEK